MHALFTVDGAAFVLIGLIVLATPSPQPALVRPVDETVALPPFRETRRLLASQFVGNGLLALVLGTTQPGAAAERYGALARLVTIALVLAINTSQLRRGFWKRAPLYVVMTVLGAVGAAYAAWLWVLVG